MGEDTGEKPERDPATGQFLAGNDGMGGGRPPGSQNKFPTNFIRVMRGLIAGETKERIGEETDPVAISAISYPDPGLLYLGARA